MKKINILALLLIFSGSVFANSDVYIFNDTAAPVLIDYQLCTSISQKCDPEVKQIEINASSSGDSLAGAKNTAVLKGVLRTAIPIKSWGSTDFESLTILKVTQKGVVNGPQFINTPCVVLGAEGHAAEMVLSSHGNSPYITCTASS
jgi:hypothetical protein